MLAEQWGGGKGRTWSWVGDVGEIHYKDNEKELGSFFLPKDSELTSNFLPQPSFQGAVVVVVVVVVAVVARVVVADVPDVLRTPLQSFDWRSL